jgi:cytochrome b
MRCSSEVHPRVLKWGMHIPSAFLGRLRPDRLAAGGGLSDVDHTGAVPRRSDSENGSRWFDGVNPSGRGDHPIKRILVWDVATRVLHAAIAGAVTLALVIGLAADDDDALFAWHMMAGLAAGFFILLRLAVGVLGSRYSRFGSWSLGPGELMRYLLGVVTGRAKRYVGHNPGTSWMSLTLFLMVGLLIVTGLSGSESGEEVHEVAGYVVLALIVLHLLGLALHTWRHRENIAWSMVDGRKQGPLDATLRSSRPAFGLAAAAIVVVGTWVLYRGFDAGTGQLWLPFRDAPIRLGEAGEGHDSDDDHHHSRGEHHD